MEDAKPVDRCHYFSLYFLLPYTSATCFFLSCLIPEQCLPSSLLPLSVHLSASGSPSAWCYSMTAECSRFYAKTNLVWWQIAPITKPQCKYWSGWGEKKTTDWQKQLCPFKSASQTAECLSWNLLFCPFFTRNYSQVDWGHGSHAWKKLLLGLIT